MIPARRSLTALLLGTLVGGCGGEPSPPAPTDTEHPRYALTTIRAMGPDTPLVQINLTPRPTDDPEQIVLPGVTVFQIRSADGFDAVWDNETLIVRYCPARIVRAFPTDEDRALLSADGIEVSILADEALCEPNEVPA